MSSHCIRHICQAIYSLKFSKHTWMFQTSVICYSKCWTTKAWCTSSNRWNTWVWQLLFIRKIFYPFCNLHYSFDTKLSLLKWNLRGIELRVNRAIWLVTSENEWFVLSRFSSFFCIQLLTSLPCIFLLQDDSDELFSSVIKHSKTWWLISIAECILRNKEFPSYYWTDVYRKILPRNSMNLLGREKTMWNMIFPLFIRRFRTRCI